MSEFLGRRIDNYHIDALLGEGGMGAVYRAHDVNLKRKVAVKVMHSHLARQQLFQQRFLQEARAAARLEHPLIVNVHDFGNQQGLLFMVMEFVPGGSLGGYMRRLQQQGKIVQLQEVLYLLAQVADALDYAHRHDIIHRDVKPDNILLRWLHAPERPGEPPLRVVVTDFGLAKLADGDVHTVTNTFMGTLLYMSPEQVLGKEIDGRSDLYSLGVILYQLATGRLPLNISSPTDAVKKHLQETPPLPQSIKPELPAKVAAIIWKAIAKEPDKRFQTGAQMASVLRQAAAELTPEEVKRFAPAHTVVSLVTELWSEIAEASTAGWEPEADAPASTVVAEPSQVTVVPGQQATIRVQFSNGSAKVGHFRLRVDGLPAQWVSIPQGPIQLMPGSSTTIPLSLHPPRDSSTLTGRHRFHLVITNVANGATVASTAGAIIVEPFTSFAVDMQPSYLAHGGAVHVAVHNKGNAKTTYTLSGRDPAGRVRFDSQQSQVTVSPGKKEMMQVRVRARKRPWLSAQQTLPFQVMVNSSDGVAQQQAGQLSVSPVLPRWLFLLLGLLLVLGVGVMVFDQIRRANAGVTPITPAGTQTAEGVTRPAAAAETAATQTAAAATTAAEIAATQTAAPAATQTAAAATAAAQVPNGRLAFVSNRNGSDAIYVMDLRNPGVADPVTQPLAGQRHWWPNWCGANRIVFEHGDDGRGQQEVAAVDLAGGAIELLTSGSRPSGSRMSGVPSCSPDRSTLAFSTLAQSAAVSNEFRIGRLPFLDGGDFSYLGDGYPLGGNVSWSPDGRAVVFMHYPFFRDRNRLPVFEIYRVELADPSTFRNLTENYAGSGKYPDWSPVSDQIAFGCTSTSSPRIWSLCLVPADGAQVTTVLSDLHFGEEESGANAVTPSWSPDGRWIAYASDQDGDWDIYVYSVVTREVINVTKDWPGDEMHPKWGP